VSLALAISLGLEKDLRQFKLAQYWPVLFLLTVGPGYVLFERAAWWWLPRPGAARAIFASSLMFAAAHANAWPAPIPLFVLALALGWLAYRTQSIIGCVVVHSLFNSVGMLELAWKMSVGR
jgi:membrane protease YdiL (CAAX protease family)